MRVFFPPELASHEDFESWGNQTLKGQTELLRQLYFRRLRSEGNSDKLDRELVRLVLEHAKRVIAHPSKPTYQKLESYLARPMAEIAMEETLEESPLLQEPAEFLVETQWEKRFSCSAILDCSSSMSGDKHLLASIAVAVLLLEVPARDSSLVVFASEANTIKSMGSEEPAEMTVLKFLRAQPRGFTNIAKGLEVGLAEARKTNGLRRVGLMATDGRSTEGGDPSAFAKLFDFLVVLHLHGPGSYLESSQQLAHEGNGVCLEVETFEELPRRLYDALRWIARR